MERSSFKGLFKPDVFNLKPEDCKDEDEFIDIVADEVWNLDEWTPEGVVMLKHFIFKMAVKDLPKEHQIDQEYLRSLIKKLWEHGVIGNAVGS